jgi:two-component system, LuxR family, response regulator FixJ
MAAEPAVFVVDDDEQARRSVCALVCSMGVRAESFASAEEFLDFYVKGSPGCLVTDMRMLGMSGQELLEELKRRKILLPVIVLTAYASTPVTVLAIQAGAVTLLEKPYQDDSLWDAIRKGLAQDIAIRPEQERRQEIRRRSDKLTPAELKVMEMMVQGKPNKAIARRLHVSIRTVENRRREIFVKMQADSVAELVRMVIEADLDR